MGLTKQYVRYIPTNIFGIIAGNKANIKYLQIKHDSSKHIAVGACEYVFIWDIKKSELKMKLNVENNKSEVTYLAQNPKNYTQLAVGYLDGSIRIFNLNTEECILTFNGHKSSITCLSYDSEGIRLVSGSKDTEIVIWDIINESGLFRLRGHKGQITKAVFMKTKNVLITSSKDTLVKFWDLDIRHCFKTIVQHRSEVLDLLLINNDERLITGSHDNQLRVFKLEVNDLTQVDNLTQTIEKVNLNGNNLVEDDENDENNQILKCTYLGSLIRESKEQISGLITNKTSNLFISYSNEKHLELYKINTNEEIRKRLGKKLKKERKRKLNEDGTKEEQNDTVEDVHIEQTINDEYQRLALIKTKHKIKTVDLIIDSYKMDKCTIAILLTNNQIEFYTFNLLSNVKEEATLIHSLSNYSHRTDVRTLAFSADSSAFLSASGDSIKLWNRLSLSCIRTFPCDYALSSLFLPDSNHVIVGCKTGKIQLFDINAAKMLDDQQAHDENASVWSLCLKPDTNGFVSGCSDHNVKFWNFELIDDEDNPTKKRLTFRHYRTLKLDDDILCVRISPNGRLLAVALLDSTVKIFFMDSLKLFLNLYGHKQPVLSMDISFDNKLIVTGSADRHMKVWGLDFGDCHRSLFAHEDSIMSVQFAGNTHYVFTCGKDGKLKEWDVDKFERIITLDGHLSEIWTLCVSVDGKFVISASHDKSMRLWERSYEPLVLEDERENENESKLDAEIGKEEQVIPGKMNNETGLATIKTIETIKSAEKLIEALDIYVEEERKREEYEMNLKNAAKEDKHRIKIGMPHPLLTALGDISAEKYVLQSLKETKSSEIETTLLILDFEHVTQLLEILCLFLNKNYEIELCLRCAVFLLKVNYGQITTTQTLIGLVENLKSLCETKLESLQNTIGFNLAGMNYLKERIEDDKQVKLFTDISSKYEKNAKKKKKKLSLLSSLQTEAIVNDIS